MNTNDKTPEELEYDTGDEDVNILTCPVRQK